MGSKESHDDLLLLWPVPHAAPEPRPRQISDKKSNQIGLACRLEATRSTIQ